MSRLSVFQPTTELDEQLPEMPKVKTAAELETDADLPRLGPKRLEGLAARAATIAPRAEPTQRFTVSLPLPAYRQLRGLSLRYDVSINEIIRLALESYGLPNTRRR